METQTQINHRHISWTDSTHRVCKCTLRLTTVSSSASIIEFYHWSRRFIRTIHTRLRSKNRHNTYQIPMQFLCKNTLHSIIDHWSLSSIIDTYHRSCTFSYLIITIKNQKRPFLCWKSELIHKNQRVFTRFRHEAPDSDLVETIRR